MFQINFVRKAVQNSISDNAGVSITFAEDAWTNQCKRRSLIYCKGLSENQGRKDGGERQISDKQTVGGIPLVTGF